MSLMKKSLTTFLFAGMSLLASAGSTNLGQELKQREVLFDGKSLVNWDYDKNFWGLQADGTLKGESTKENRTRSSTFIISKDHSYADFEIELDYKIPTHNNSGVIYRCSEIGEKGSYRVSGYQAEGENKLSKGGFMFDESRRGWLASPGELVVIQERGAKKIIGAVNRPIDLSEQKFVNYREWNHYRIVARGNHFMHYINGHLSIELIDRDTRLKDSSRRGAIALQLHGGSPMTVFDS
ncbi:MAG: DUF1080 domain-containing protein [Lentisphaeraceae bacterium]|nr:DUF1080 domain-containing protein [Lentisphaeraceae bacterium]